MLLPSWWIGIYCYFVRRQLHMHMYMMLNKKMSLFCLQNTVRQEDVFDNGNGVLTRRQTRRCRRNKQENQAFWRRSQSNKSSRNCVCTTWRSNGFIASGRLYDAKRQICVTHFRWKRNVSNQNHQTWSRVLWNYFLRERVLCNKWVEYGKRSSSHR